MTDKQKLVLNFVTIIAKIGIIDKPFFKEDFKAPSTYDTVYSDSTAGRLYDDLITSAIVNE